MDFIEVYPVDIFTQFSSNWTLFNPGLVLIMISLSETGPCLHLALEKSNCFNGQKIRRCFLVARADLVE